MRIIYTKHAENKFIKLSKQGAKITKENVSNTLEFPDHVDEQIDFPKIIASKKINEKLILRVVFKRKDDIITVITFYPARRGRYYENEKN